MSLYRGSFKSRFRSNYLRSSATTSTFDLLSRASFPFAASFFVYLQHGCSFVFLVLLPVRINNIAEIIQNYFPLPSVFYSNLRLDSDLLSVEGRLSSALFAVDLGPPLLCPPVV